MCEGDVARQKTETRRAAIVKTAAEAFLELGYEKTSMSLIAERLGGSKATLYSYFKSKEELLLAVLDNEIDTNAAAILGTAMGEPDTRKALSIVGAGYLMQRLSVRPTRYFRMVSGQSGESDIGQHFWNNILKPAWMLMCTKMQEYMDEGRLRQADPWMASMHFKGLLEADLVERRLLGDIRGPEAELVMNRVTSAVEVFLHSYGPQRAPLLDGS
jgi:AcrR family transcriptional regulator